MTHPNITSTLSVEDSPLPAETATPPAVTLGTPCRTLHLVDADNLIGDPRTTDRRTIEAAFDAYRRAAGYQPGDHVVIATGCNGLHVLEVELAWPSASHRRRRGTDGADLELLEAADFAATSCRYSRVVIGSGDHIFVLALEKLRAASIKVEIVAARQRLASVLAARAHGNIRYLTTEPEPAMTVRPAA